MNQAALKTITEPIERPEAAIFLENNTSQDLRAASERFFFQNDDLLPYRYGVVAQFKEQADGGSTITVIFDARELLKSCVWEITSGSRGAREILQTRLSGDDLSGRRFRTSVQGVLVENTPMSQEELEGFQSRLFLILGGAAVKDTIEQTRQRKENETLRFGEMFEKSLRTSPQGKCLYRQFTESEIKAHLKRINDIGFTPLPPFEPR